MKMSVVKSLFILAIGIILFSSNSFARITEVIIGKHIYRCVTNDYCTYNGNKSGDARWSYDYVGTIKTQCGNGMTEHYTRCLNPGLNPCHAEKISGDIKNDNGILVSTADEVNDYVFNCENEMFLKASEGEESGSRNDNIIRNQFIIYRNFAWTYNPNSKVFDYTLNITFTEQIEVED